MNYFYKEYRPIKNNQFQMYIEIITSLAILVVTTIVYFVWIKPMKILNNYEKILKEKGYSVLKLPYNPVKNEMIETLRKGIEQGDALKLYKQHYKNYDVIISNMLTTPKLQFNHPDFIKDFYSVDKYLQYHKQKKIVDTFARVAGHGLPFSQGATWKRKRAVLNKVFNFDFIKSQSQKISTICADSIKQLENQSKKKNETQNNVTYNILDLTVQMFSGVMMQIFLGGTEHQTINGIPAGKFLKKLVGDISQQSFYPINFILGPKFLSLGITAQQRDIQQRIRTYRRWGLQFIKKRMSQIQMELQKNPNKKQASDIIQSLMIAKRNLKNNNNSNEEEEIIYSEQQILQQFNAFFIAGTDTTSNFTQMMIYSIAKHPQIEQKVRAQIEQYMKNEDYSYENLKNLKYIQQIQKETTRYYGPGTHLFSRQAINDNYLNGIPIRKGTGVSIMVMGNHFSQKYFKDPFQFKPERWESECKDISPFIFGGFSGGARTCIGKHLAMIQSKIAFVKFMKRYSKIKLGNQDFKMTFKFLYSPEQFDSTMTIHQ